ncbi:unnamed protein product [Paramecium sonneborni]|uniref:Cyclic nucleotide-binding domain-containing protein n=1 Tax=Paramecium sonneborni TaxID=65129 RepID=A0A8S1LGH2_9CILI|nr:unnamed protein product [Paramecium sonneborni]
MHLIPKLTKLNKSQEDISAIQDHLSQLPQFQAPYEVLKDLCKTIGYVFFETGQVVQQNNKFAFYIINGLLNTQDNLLIQPEMWYEAEQGFEAKQDTHCFALPLVLYKKFSSTHGVLYQQKKKSLIVNLPIIEKIAPKIQEQLIRLFQEVKFAHTDFIQKMDEPGNSLFILQFGVLSITKNYQKALSHYEKSVLPRKFWFNEIVICELIDQGILGEEFTNQEKALYNVQVISKSASLLMISIQQLKNIFPQVYQSICKMFKEKTTLRDEIYKQKCQELEKNWQNTNKDQMLNQDIKKTISFKVLSKQPSACQDQQSQTNDDQFGSLIGNLSYKKMPTFIQQYFRQKHIKVKKRQDQYQLNNSNSSSLNNIDSTFDPYVLLQKTQQKMLIQQNSLKQQNGLRLTKTRQMDRKLEQTESQQIRPNTSQIMVQQQFSLGQTQQQQQSQNQQGSGYRQELIQKKTIFQGFHTPKPIIRQLKRMYRSSSVHKIENPPFSLIPQLKNKTPRENMFYLNLQQNYSGQRIKVNQLLHNSID